MKGRKTGGRKKGTPNKATAPLREWIASIIDSNRDTAEADIKALDPADRLKYLERLMGYILPKPAAVAVSVTAEPSPADELAKPPGLILCGFEPWDEMSDKKKARHLAEYYKQIADGTDGGIHFGFGCDDDDDPPAFVVQRGKSY